MDSFCLLTLTQRMGELLSLIEFVQDSTAMATTPQKTKTKTRSTRRRCDSWFGLVLTILLLLQFTIGKDLKPDRYLFISFL